MTEPETRTLTGGCLCGRVRLEVRLPCRFVAHCHCPNCRRAHGAAFVTFAGFPDDDFRWTAGAEVRTDAPTDTGATRSFCSLCGSTLTYKGPRWPDEIHVAAACLDGPLDKPPQAHVYVDHKADWFDLPDDGLKRLGGTSGSEPLD